VASSDTTLTIVGNLTGEPELKFIPSGVAVAKFTVASTPRILDRTTGQWADGDPLFLTCTAWRDLAEHIAESLTKGARVIVTGRLKLSRWETPEGEKRSAYGLDVDEVGPSLRFATAQVKKMTRTGAAGGNLPVAPDDAWATAAPTRPAGPAAVPTGFDEEPPF
jgi:single-strand DNA-binding protein